MTQIIPKPENLAQLVFLVRGEKVLLDADLAMLYGVETGALNRAVKRNIERFPADFMLQLTPQEWENLKCQIGISSASTSASASKASNSSQTVMSGSKNKPLKSQIVISSAHGGRRAIPYAFTEQGVAMLSSVLRSQRAVEVNIAIMRTFVQLRRLMDSNRDLARRIEAMEMRYDEQFSAVFDAIKQLISDDQAKKSKPNRAIGFL
ncbi:MAG: ORF6N domain-containing protein [Polaromonas sp.]|nr:ORF6N domain-containing protein [Polaromonas sp.]